MAEFLLELLSEEIPARMQARAAEDLKRLVCEGLEKAGLAYSTAEAYVTPRRLALVVDGLPTRQPDRREERRGPRVGAPQKAIEGFLRAAGLDSVELCETREVKGVSYHFAVIEEEGAETAEVLPGIAIAAIRGLPWPKSMRWGGTSFAHVRPLQNILCLFDGWPAPGAMDLGGGVSLTFNPKTLGHRFLAPDEILVGSFADYRDKLAKAYVMVDPAERRAAIWKQATALAARRGLTVKDDDALLAEVAGLVEWPVVLLGRIDDAFMELPPEVLVTSMRTHQRYFATTTREGHMAPYFLTVANIATADDGAAIVAGNERVLRARLADARFFWEQDRSQSLSSRAPSLSQITFHAKLGSIDAKVDRVQALAVEIAASIKGANKDRVRTAARLAKADLTTGMVGEFPELQGIMGRYYALLDGEHPDVADAIAQHYAPQGPSDACPTAPVSIAVALADKIDTLVGFFAIGEKPTGSKDPYALRRAALGVIRLIVENRLRLALDGVFETARRMLAVEHAADPETVRAALIEFFLDRMRVHLRDQGIRHDVIAAVFAQGGDDDLVRLLARVEALKGFVESDDGRNLVIAYRRATNIVRIEEKKDRADYSGAPDRKKLQVREETTLFEVLQAAAAGNEKLLKREDHVGAMTVLAALRAPVDAFFEKVTVNTDDAALRQNRLRLLAWISTIMDRVADFSKLEG